MLRFLCLYLFISISKLTYPQLSAICSVPPTSCLNPNFLGQPLIVTAYTRVTWSLVSVLIGHVHKSSGNFKTCVMSDCFKSCVECNPEMNVLDDHEKCFRHGLCVKEFPCSVCKVLSDEKWVAISRMIEKAHHSESKKSATICCLFDHLLFHTNYISYIMKICHSLIYSVLFIYRAFG